MASGDTVAAWKAIEANTASISDPARLVLRNGRWVLAFDDTANESAHFEGILGTQVPPNADYNVKIQYCMESATTLTVDWDVQWEVTEDAGHNIDSDSFAAAQSVDNTTVPGTAGITDVVTIAFTNAQADDTDAGEAFRIKVTRDAASDDATGDAQILRVWIEEQ